METRISVQSVGKQFTRRDPDRARTFKELLVRGYKGLGRSEKFWALSEVTFQVKPGQMVGIIGRNGAGKSTLLRLVGGVSRPDHGSIETNGRIGALIEVGAGYHPDLTGRENVLINGVIAGLSQAELGRRFQDIVEFAELEDFIDSPLRTYSSGMQMRLAFSVAVHVDPEILLVDEVLAVGDLAFQHKCLEQIADFKRQGCAILLVSHDTGLIRRLCDEAVWLEHGKVIERGVTHRVVDRYVEAMQMETRRRTPQRPGVVRLPDGTELKLNENRMGSLEVEIERVRLLGSHGEELSGLLSGSCINVEIDFFAPQPVEGPIFGVTITSEEDQVLFDASTATSGLLPEIRGRGQVVLRIERLDLAPGRFFMDVGIYQRDWDYAYDYHWHVYPFLVEAERGFKGLILPPHHWEFRL